MRFAMIFLLGLLFSLPVLQAQPLPRDERTLEQKVASLEEEVRELKSSLRQAAPVVGMVPILFGIFCALWAQNTRRNAVLWFFLGLIFTIATGFVVLMKNASDRGRRQVRRFAEGQRLGS